MSLRRGGASSGYLFSANRAVLGVPRVPAAALGAVDWVQCPCSTSSLLQLLELQVHYAQAFALHDGCGGIVEARVFPAVHHDAGDELPDHLVP